MAAKAYRRHLKSSDDLVTTYEAQRAGFVALALEKNRRATPFIEQARALKAIASQARTPNDLLRLADRGGRTLENCPIGAQSYSHCFCSPELRPADIFHWGGH